MVVSLAVTGGLTTALVLAKPSAAERPAGKARVSFDKDVRALFERNCTAGTGCHARETAAAGLRLDGGDPYTVLVNAPSRLQPRRRLVVPGKPQDSVVWLKLTGKHKQAGIFGDRMPPKRALPPGELRIIQRWISAAASH
jgi:hypothetical protein